MNGLQLASMEASDMLDVLHYFFEEDLNFSTAEQADAREKSRVMLYENLYNTEYKYATTGQSHVDYDSLPYDDENDQDERATPVDSFNPAAKVKPYTAPTRFDPSSSLPFGNVLDAPFGQ